MTIGFIGAGNMATAIIKGLISKEFINQKELFITSATFEQTQTTAASLGVNPVSTNQELATQVDTIILAVKPHLIAKVLSDIQPVLESSAKLIISIAAGLTLDNLQDLVGTTNPQRIIRSMPNMNVAINRGVTAVCGNSHASLTDVEFALSLFSAVGTAYSIEEKDFRNFTSLAGCSPAFTYLYIDAMSRAGVKNGLSKELATRIAAEAVFGSAQMVLESNEDTPWDLIDKVCSPGGTTVAGLITLEEEKFMATVVKALDATIARDKELEG